MLHQRRSKVFFAAFMLGSLILNSVGCNAPVSTPDPFGTTVPTVTGTTTSTGTRTLPVDSEPQAWLDGTIDTEQFSPNDSLIIHFNMPMDVHSSLAPVLSWPSLEGSSSWDRAHTTLTFWPAAALDNNAVYTFFLDPALRSTSGEALNNPPEWQVLTRSGPEVVRIFPSDGDLDRRYAEISITFDQEMMASLDSELISIEPAIPFQLSWKTPRVLQLKLEKPFGFGQRYKLTLRQGILTAKGSYLEEDYVWFYQQLSPHAQAELESDKEVRITFNYKFSRQKTGLDFSISPALQGTWRWNSDGQVVFRTATRIPAEHLYSVNYPTLVDVNGFEVAAPSVQFSGTPPVILLADTDPQQAKYNIRKYEYEQEIYYSTDEDLDDIQLEFLVPINRSSAEQAFSVTPAVSGTIHWEKSSENRDILVYKLDQFLQRRTHYTIELKPTITDTQGRLVMALPFTERIWVNEYTETYPSFGDLGHNIQILDVQGPRRLQYAPGKEQAIFSAYRLELIDFVELYPQDRSRSSSGILDVAIPAETKLTASWSNSSRRDLGQERFVNETTLPSDLEPGLYVVNAIVGKILYDQMFVVLSRNKLVVKENGRQVTAWVTDPNGTAVEKAEIRVYNIKGEKVREGVSDENGLYTVSMPDGDIAMLVSARVRERGKQDDITLAGLNFSTNANDQNGWFRNYSSWLSYNNSLNYDDPAVDLPKGQPVLAYIYTERPIYKPGQTVNFKAILRQDDDMRYSLPETGTPVTVRVQDARKNNLHTFTLMTSDFGSVNGNFVIPEAAMLGRYTIEVEISGITSAQSFRIEDYRKPDYLVSITSLQPEKQNRYVRGEDVRVQVHVSYYFGEPVAGARLRVEAFYGHSLVPTSASGELITNAQGDAILTVKAPHDSNSVAYRWWDTGMRRTRLQITADDGSHQSVIGHYYFDVYPTIDQITLDTGGYYAQPGEPINVEVTDLDIFNRPVVGQDLRLVVQPWNSDKREFDTTTEELAITTDANGKASLQLTLNTGYYKLNLTGQDTRGSKIDKSQWMYIFKDKNDWFNRQVENQLVVSSEKDRYKPYEKVRLAIESTFSGPAWLTFERGSVINSKQIQLTAPMTIIETDVIPEHAPNVFITVNAWQKAMEGVYRYSYADSSTSSSDSYLRIARTHVQVDASTKALDITITPDKQTYLPDETVQAKIQVQNSTGQPVVAELSLAVVDESIFALAKDNALSIFDAFYNPRGLAVDTYDTMAPWRFIYHPDFGGGGGEVPPELRVDFLDTSSWLPVVETDDQGRATVQFTLPDNTTRWRLSVKAVTRQHQVGQAQTYVETKKELFVHPIVPRNLTQGDSATLTTFVHNYSNAVQTAQVSLDAPGLKLNDPASQQVSLKPGEMTAVGWRVKVLTGTPTQVTIRVRAGRLQDGVQLPLSIQPAVVREVQTQSGQFSDTTTLGLNLPQVDKENSRVMLTLNRSLSGTLLNGLEYLTGYPYGCVEQTMSRALPNAVVAHAASELGLDNAGLQNELAPLIQASLVKLYGLQHSDGGWGWWFDDYTDAYQTAWVLFGLSVIRDSGYAVEPRVIEEAADWLKSNSHPDPRIQAYVLYSLARAGQGDQEGTLRLVKEIGDELDPFSQAAIALALHNMGEEQQARDVLDLLEQSSAEEGDYVYWPQSNEDGQYNKKTMSSSLRTTALALQAHVEIDPQNPRIPDMVQYLASKRKGTEGWGTTNETSYAILALTEYLAMQNKTQSATPYQVLLNGQSLVEGVLAAGQPSMSLEIPIGEISEGANDLQLIAKSDAQVYFDLITQYSRLKASSQALGNIKVSRRYFKPSDQIVANRFKANDLVQVELTIEVPEDISYFALEDYLPGGLEGLNERLNASLEPTESWSYEAFLWEDYGYNYKEIRGDRVVFFITSLAKGKHTFTYMARATTIGQFTALPVQAYAMYDLSLWGRSDSTNIQITR
jgi:alpha-2-macroglobulin